MNDGPYFFRFALKWASDEKNFNSFEQFTSILHIFFPTTTYTLCFFEDTKNVNSKNVYYTHDTLYIFISRKGLLGANVKHIYLIGQFIKLTSIYQIDVYCDSFIKRFKWTENSSRYDAIAFWFQDEKVSSSSRLTSAGWIIKLCNITFC